MSNTVHTQFTSDDAQIERVMRRLEDQNAKLIQQNRMLARETRQAATQVNATLDTQFGKLQALAGGYMGLHTIVGRLTAEYDRWDQKLTAIGTKAQAINRSFVLSVAGAGDLGNVDEINRFIAGQADARIVTREQALAAYGGVSGGAPAATLSTRLDLASQASRLAPLVEDLRAFGSLLGELHVALPKLQSGDVADLALSLQERAGSNSQKLTSASFLRSIRLLMESGAVKDPETGFAFGLSALDASMEPEVVEKLASSVSGDFKLRRPGPGQPYTAADRAYNRFTAADATNRLDMLLNDPLVAQEIMGREAANRLKLLTRDSVDQIAGGLRSDVAADYVGQRLSELGRSGPGARVIADQRLAATADESVRRWEFDSEQTERVRKFRDAMIDKYDPTGPDFLHVWSFNTELARQRLIGAESPAVEALRGMETWIPQQELSRFIEAETRLRSQASEEQANLLRQIEMNTRQTPPPVVNVHTETR